MAKELERDLWVGRIIPLYVYNLILSLTRLLGPDICVDLCAWTNMAAKFVFNGCQIQ